MLSTDTGGIMTCRRMESGLRDSALSGETTMRLNWLRELKKRFFPSSRDFRRGRRKVQGQLLLRLCAGKDFDQERFAPATSAAFHCQAVLARMLLQ